jgi:hypothetical protein
MSVGKNQQNVKRGQPLTAKRLTNIGKDAQRNIQTNGANNRRFHDGVTVDYPQLKGNAPAGLVVRWAKVVDVFNDCLSCAFIQTVTPLNVQTITIDGTAISDPFYVAKPWALQVSPFDGNTITYIDGEQITYTKDATDPEFKRNHSDGVDNADFIITPNYYIGEWLTIARLPSPVVLPGGSSYTVLDWIDMNNAGRYWAREE